MIKDKAALEKVLSLNDDERAWFDDKRSSTLEFGISDYIAGLLNNTPIRRQFIPNVAEFDDDKNTLDPLREEESTKSEKRLIHRYKSRVALLLTDRCFSYCRHCFRRRFTSHMAGGISDRELEFACNYIKNDKDITEILLTGGDPLTLDNERLDFIFSSIREVRKDIIIRLCTRAILSSPKRLDNELLDIISAYNEKYPVFLMVQFNSPCEITADVRAVLDNIRRRGLFCFNQSVLLKGVNDNTKLLCELSNTLLSLGVKPYYIFLLDKVKGIEHFRVSVRDTMELERGMRGELSGLAMPQFAIDLPDSGGKIPVYGNYIKRLDEGLGRSVFISPDGNIREY